MYDVNHFKGKTFIWMIYKLSEGFIVSSIGYINPLNGLKSHVYDI